MNRETDTEENKLPATVSTDLLLEMVRKLESRVRALEEKSEDLDHRTVGLVRLG
jgi:predicted ATP-grasp superfamily ATP-dependent carboligase